MASLSAFKVAIILLCAGTSRAGVTGAVPVRVPEDMCEPCQGHALRIEGCDRDQYPVPSEVAREVVKEMTSSLNTARYLVLKERQSLQAMYDIPDNFTTLVDIDDLTDIENNTRFSKHLKTKIKPRYILQLIYTRTLLFSAYTDALGKIYQKSSRALSEGIENITLELKRITCTTADLFGNLGLGKIKRGLTRRLCSYRKQIDGTRITDYETSILAHGVKLIDDSIADLDDLVRETNMCSFNCRVGKKLKLKCGKRARHLKTGRKGRKNKKGRRKNRKNQRNKSNRINKKNEKRNKSETKKSNQKKNRRRGNKNKQNRLA